MTPEEIRLLAPLERFTDLHARTVRRHGGRLIDLSFPNPRVDREPRAFEALRRLASRIDQAELQYTPFGGSTPVRRRVAAALTRRFGLPFGYRDVVLTPGGTAALVIAMTALFAPGDDVLLVTPCWMDYPVYLARLGVTVTPVPLGPDKRLDLDRLASAISARTAGLVLSQPGCPTGVVHGEPELAALAALLDRAAAGTGRRPVIVSDEVHRDHVWGRAALRSPMQSYPDSISVYSFGKAWSLQGQRTGYLAVHPAITGHDGVVDAMERAARATGFAAPTALMQRLVVEIVDLVPDIRPLRADQHRLRSILAGAGCEPVPADATAFVYARCPAGLDDWDLVERLARHGLLAMPSSVFHEPGHFRLALNVGADRLDEVDRRLRSALSEGARPAPAWA